MPRPRARSRSALQLAGHNQTFGMDETSSERCLATPAGQPKGILLIGVGISRFIGPPAQGGTSSTRLGLGLAQVQPVGTAALRRSRRRSPKRARENSCRAGWTAAGPVSCSTAQELRRHRSDHQDRQGERPAPRALRPAARRRRRGPRARQAAQRHPLRLPPSGRRSTASKYLGFTGAINLPSSASGTFTTCAPRRARGSRGSRQSWSGCCPRQARRSSKVLLGGRARHPRALGDLAAGAVARSPGLPGAERGTCCP